MKPQSFANHARYVPLFHFVLSAILLFNLAWTIVHLAKAPSAQHVVDVVMAVAFAIMFVYIRYFPLRVQDRVIRLEETLRIQRLAPDLAARLEEFTPEQFVGLRFASDAELPALARRVLDEKLTDRTAIKKLVKQWRADYLRA